ncbi:MAG: SRPBCC domain-containing protein [Dehalococcoidia bacterium]
MIVEGQLMVAAPTERVWQFIFDVEAMASCVPGMERAEQIDDKTYAGAVTARVGPISATFEVKGVIADVEPLQRIVLNIDGRDKRTASTLKGKMVLDLASLSQGGTQLSYKADVSIRGRLGQFGDGIIRETASLLIDDFAARMRSRLEAGPEAIPEPEAKLSVTNLAGRLALRRGRGLVRGLAVWLGSKFGRLFRPVHRRP